MTKAGKIVYGLAIAFIFGSPLLHIDDTPLAVIQNWPMYTGTVDICNVHFTDPEGVDPRFNEKIRVLLNQATGKAVQSRWIIRDADSVSKVFRLYCSNPVTRIHPFHAEYQCFKDRAWNAVHTIGDFPCEK